jgi:hypothetical protein
MFSMAPTGNSKLPSAMLVVLAVSLIVLLTNTLPTRGKKLMAIRKFRFIPGPPITTGINNDIMNDNDNKKNTQVLGMSQVPIKVLVCTEALW